MLTESEVTGVLCYYKEQLAACEVESFKSPLRLVIKTLEEVLEIEEIQ